MDSALKLNFKEVKKYYLQIERKFDKSIKYSGILFHVTPYRKLEKILKLGLCQKSGNKKSSQPDRIYLCYRYQVNTLLKLLKEYDTILEININQLKIFNDPESNGCYTLENIPKEKIITIYDEKWNVKKSNND